jgi:hypothetical protein
MPARNIKKVGRKEKFKRKYPQNREKKKVETQTEKNQPNSNKINKTGASEKR